MSSNTLNNYVTHSSFKDIAKNIKKINDNYKRVLSFARGAKNIERTNKNVALVNIASGVNRCLNLINNNISVSYDISLVALCTRNIFELNIRARAILDSDTAVNIWMEELAMDKKQIYDAILTIADERHSKQVDILENAKLEIKKLLDKHGLKEINRPETVKSLSENVGLMDDYNILFKLFSKLLHPTSYLINDFDDASSLNNFNILIIHLQLYSVDLLERLKYELKVVPGIIKY